MARKDGLAYNLKVIDFATVFYGNLPELSLFTPEYGSTTIFTNKVTFGFNGDTFPAKRLAVKGKIIIYRGAVKSDGTIIRIGSDVLH